MKTNLLSDGLAIEFQDVYLGAPDDVMLDQIRDLWMRNKVAVFRDQSLPDVALVGFTRRLGPTHIHVRDQNHDARYPEIMFVSNVKEDGRDLSALGNGELRWHTDQSYTPKPVNGTMLYGVEIPKDGGAT